MGYSYYEIPKFWSGKPMKRGYGVDCKCHKRGCEKEIDRGLAYLCYYCGWYYCEEHLTEFWDKDKDEPVEFECFAGESSQICERCEKLLQTDVPPLNKIDKER